MKGGFMERDLRTLTLDKMINYGYIEFYLRDIDFDKIREGYFSKGDVTSEVLLLEEQILSDKIYSLLECIVGETILDIRMVRFDYHLGIKIYYSDGTEDVIDNVDLVRGAYKYFKQEGINKGEVHIKQSKYSHYWEVGIGKDFDFGDCRVSCKEFLLEAIIVVTRNNLIPVI